VASSAALIDLEIGNWKLEIGSLANRKDGGRRLGGRAPMSHPGAFIAGLYRAAAGAGRGSDEGGTMLLMRIVVTKLPYTSLL